MQTDGAGTVTWIDIPASIADGTILHATLRWDGVDWVENSNILINPAADIDIQADATTGFVNLDSPVIFGPYSGVTGAVYGFNYTAVESFTGGFVGGGLNFSGVITFSNSLFIYEAFRGAPNITSGVNPGFAAFTVLQAIPILNAGAGAGNNPLAATVLNANPTFNNPFSGARTTSAVFGTNFGPQVRASLFGAVMNLTTITGLNVQPTYSTVGGSTANFGTIRGLHMRNPAVGLFQPSAGTEIMTAYVGVDIDAIPFGGNVLKVGIRSNLAPASLTRFIQNLGGAESQFGVGHIHFDDNGMVNFGNTVASPDAAIFYDASNLILNPAFVPSPGKVRIPTGGLIVEGDAFPVSDFIRRSASTNLVLSAWRLTGQSSNDMVDGFGTALFWTIEDDAAVKNNIGYWSAERAGADNTGLIRHFVYTAGVAGQIFEASGNIFTVNMDMLAEGTLGVTGAVTGLTFNGVPLTTAGVATNFLDETGAYSVPAGGTAIDPGVNLGDMTYWDTGSVAWVDTPNLQWLEATRELKINTSVGGQVAIRIVPTHSTNYVALRMEDQASHWFQLVHDYALSSLNQELILQSSSFGDIIEIENEGNIYLGGTEGTARLKIQVSAFYLAGEILIDNGATLFHQEIAAAQPSNTGEGQYWTRDDAPNVPMFTDDTGQDFNLLEVQGGSSIIAAYRFQTSIVESDPGNGNLRYDNATPASVTELFISATTDNGVDLQNILSFISAGDRIYFQQDNDASKYLLFDVTVNVDNGGWFSFAGTVSNSGTIPDSNAKCHILILFGASASGVASVSGGTNINVSGTAADPIVNLDVAVLGISVNGVTLSTAGAATSYLDETGTYSVPAGGGQVDSVSGGTNINVTGTAADPIVNLDAAVLGTSVNGVTLSNAGAATSYLDETGAYSVPAGAGIQATPTPAVGEIAIWDSTGATLTGDPNLTFIGSAFSITGFLAVSSTVNFDSLFYIQQMGAAGADVPTYGQAWYDSADDRLKWTPDTGVDNILAYVSELGGQVDSVSGGTNINVSGTAADPIVNLDAAITGVSVNAVTLNAAGAATEYLDETGAYSVPAGSGGVAPGATTGSILRWSGAAWLENTNVNIQGSGLFELTRSGAILRLRTTGASLNENVTDIRMENFSGFVIQAITDGGSNSNFLMNANRTGVVWQNLQMSVSTEIFGSLYLDDNDGPLANLAGRGQLYVLAADDTLHYRDETGSDFDLTLSGGQVDSVAGGTNINVSGTGVDPIVNLDAAITGVSVNAVTLTAAGAATNFLNETGAYSVPPSSGITATPTPASGEVTVWDSTGATVTGFPALTFDGTELSSPELTATGNGVGSGASLQVKGTTSVGIYLEGGGGVADERNWAISNINNGTFAILPYSDIDVAGSAILAANRVGNTVDIITMVASATIALSAPVVTATEVTATTFNDVPLTDGGVVTNFLNETGAYSVPPGGSATPAGVDTEVQYNDSGSFGADGSLVWNGTRLLIGDDGVGGTLLDLRDGNSTGNPATATIVFTDQVATIQGSLQTFPFFNLFHLSGEASVQISAQGGEQTISMSGFLRCRTATAAEFDDITDPINTDIGKQQGCQCYDLTNDVPVWSTGTGAGDVWVNGVGTTVRTPV
jgi:hypothetical protein